MHLERPTWSALLSCAKGSCDAKQLKLYFLYKKYNFNCLASQLPLAQDKRADHIGLLYILKTHKSTITVSIKVIHLLIKQKENLVYISSVNSKVQYRMGQWGPYCDIILIQQHFIFISKFVFFLMFAEMS